MADKVRVFISWSGELSKKLAEAIREWLPAALQFVRPYFTPADTEKGTKWRSEIATELEKSETGIICLTSENLDSPWILFEAGALSKRFESHVCTLLFDLDPTSVAGPLSLFQHTRFTKADFGKLVETINKAGGESELQQSVLSTVFEKFWPDLEAKVAQILAEHAPGGEGTSRSRELGSSKMQPEAHRKLRVLIHRARFTIGGPDHYFINVTNLSENRAVEITHVWFETNPQVHVMQPFRPLPKRLKPDETWETWIPVDALPIKDDEKVFKLGRVRMSNDTVVKSQKRRCLPSRGFVPGP